jgi:hypothetical protein
MQRSPLLGYVALAIISLAVSSLYVGGYVWLGEYSYNEFPGNAYRMYSSRPLKWLYLPMGKIESQLRGYAVHVMTGDDYLYYSDLLISSPPIIDPEAYLDRRARAER